MNFSVLVTLQQAFSLIAYACKFQMAPGFLTYPSYILTLIAVTASSMSWLKYLLSLLEDHAKRSGLRSFLFHLPVILMVITAVSSPWTHWLFYFDESMNYHPGPYVIIQYVLPYSYILIAMAIALIRLIKGKRKTTTDLLLKLLVYTIPTLFGVYAQRVIFRGGYTYLGISIAMLFTFVDHYLQAEKENALYTARLQAMVSQIRPHFVLNSLTCIGEVCHEDPQKASESIGSFCGYLRSCFGSLENDGLIPFSQELGTIRNYISMEMLRSPDDLNMVYDIRETDFMLPILTVETLVENAVKHGIRKKPGGGTVKLSTFHDGYGYVIRIEDDGTGFDPDQLRDDPSHIGLSNARERLRRQCGARWTLTSRPGSGTKIEIMIPDDMD